MNVESRLETLRHYQILWSSNSPGFKTGFAIIDRPLIVNTELDTVVLKLTSRSMFSSENMIGYRGPRLWVDYLEGALKGGLQSISTCVSSIPAP
jgi:hypothetical protein